MAGANGRAWEPFYDNLPDAEAAIGQYRQVVRSWVPAKGITFIVSQRGMGKTTVLIDQGLTIASDVDNWHGYAVDPGYWVVYICGERGLPQDSAAEADPHCDLP